MSKSTVCAALAAGLAIGAATAFAQVLPESGPLPKVTMERLLLLDATHRGTRVIAVGDRGYIVLSDDNGRTWRRAKSPAAPLLTAVEFVDAKNGWAVGHDSVILATADGGDTWVQQFAAPAEQRPLLDVTFLDKDTGYAIGAYGAFYETTDGGRSWKDAALEKSPTKYGFARFVLPFRPAAPGRYRIAARATDEARNVQPAEPAWNPSGYRYNAVDVEVRS